MCQKCVDAVKQYFPDVPDYEYGNFLISVTVFPMGDGNIVTEQLRELRDKTSNWKECYGIVEDELELELRTVKDETIQVS